MTSINLNRVIEGQFMKERDSLFLALGQQRVTHDAASAVATSGERPCKGSCHYNHTVTV